MNREIPGYYYDEEQKRYFKIENSRTAPGQASWASTNVKRRKLEDQKEEARREREVKNAGRIKRTVGVWDEPLVGGCFLGRELGGTGRVDLEHSGHESWTMGLKDKGRLSMFSPFGPTEGDITSMYIGGGELNAKSGLGVAYAVLNGDFMVSSYIPRDDQDQINFGYAAVRYPRINCRPHLERRIGGGYHYQSAHTYHAPTHRMIFATANGPRRLVRVGLFSPALSEDSSENQPCWTLGNESRSVARFVVKRVLYPAVTNQVHTIKAAPACSSVTALVGTSHGILKLQDNDEFDWLIWNPPSIMDLVHPKRGRGGRGGPFGQGSSHQPETKSHEGEDARPLPDEVYSLDFLAQSPAEVFLAAGRSKDISLLDMRCSAHQGAASYIRHKSLVAHVRSVGDYGILAAGPKSSMALYDVRFNSYRRQSSSILGAGSPVVTFPEYRNEPHVQQIGFDVSDAKDGGLGIVAAAQDNGTVALFSLKSGRKLRSPVVDTIQVQQDGNPRWVRSLMFQTLPGDRQPSLFVGEGKHIKKYSFGMKYSKRGGVVFEDED